MNYFFVWNILNVIFPKLTEELGNGDKKEFYNTFRQALRMITWIALPVSVIAFFARGYVTSFISNIGNKTLEILTWHFLSFKLVSLVIIACYRLPIEHLAEFPVMHPYNVQGWWVLYLVTGIAVPLIGTVFTKGLTKTE